LACGRAPWGPRRIEGRDIVTWLAKTTWFDTPLSSLTSPSARITANVQLTGRGGGHDLHYRVLQGMGVTLLGHLTDVDGNTARFAPDLLESVAFGDARYRDVRRLMQDQLSAKGIAVPDLPEPPPFHADPPLEVALEVSVPSSLPPAFARTMRAGSGFRPLTGSGFRSRRTVPVPPCPGCTSSAFTSSAPGSRRSYSGSARMRRSWRAPFATTWVTSR